MWLVDGDHFLGAKVINYIVTLLYYISNPLICFLWLMYTDFKIHESRIGLKKRVGFSPNIADALALSFARPVIKRDRISDGNSGSYGASYDPTA